MKQMMILAAGIAALTGIGAVITAKIRKDQFVR